MDAESPGWRRQPILAAAISATVAILPIAAGVVSAIVASRLVPKPRGPAVLLWWAGELAISGGVSILVAHQARRLLPLAALLRLTMAFPDRTPSRFRVALMAGTVRNLEGRLAEVRDEGIPTDTATAAETILVLASAMNAHDRRTRGHAERVRALAELVGDELDLTPEDKDRLRWSALLHDVGKVMIDPAILNKTEKLDEDDWAAIHRHPDDGARIAAPLNDWLGEWALVIEQHHERYDGSGYPRHLAGAQISLGGRIVAVADSYEVMTAARSYKEAMSTTAARQELTACAGTHFDPRVVRAFLNVSIGRVRWVMGPLSWVVQMPFLRFVAAAASNATSAIAGAAVVVTGTAMTLMPLAPDPPTTASSPPQETGRAPSARRSTTTISNAVDAADVTTSPTSGVTPGPGSSPGVSGAPLPVGQAPGGIAPSTTRPPGTTRTPTTSPAGGAQTTTTGPSGNRAPIARDDRAATQTRPSKPVKIAVLTNDSDPDGNLAPGTVRIVQEPQRGRANVSGGGDVNYVPNSDAAGGDRFVYEVCDTAGACATAAVTIDF